MAKKTSFLYVLTSSHEDFYCEQAIFSITSLKKYNPDAYIILLTERDTYKSLTGFRAKIKELANKVKVIDFPSNLSLTVRSRLLKTSMRNLIRGDFLYIDCDTIICKNLEKINKLNCQMGAVLVMHKLFDESCSGLNILMKKLNFAEIPIGGKYFNGGILYVKDTKQTRDFFKLWNKLYLHCVSTKNYKDQMSLNEANKRFANIIKELPGYWNCMPSRGGFNYLCDAKIFHYVTTMPGNEDVHILLDIAFWEKIREKGKMDKFSMNAIKNVKKLFGKFIPVSQNSLTYPSITIEKRKLQNKKLYIWGCGLDAYFTLGACKKNGLHIEGFIDSNLSGSFCGYNVQKSNAILNRVERNFFIIISSRKYSKEIGKICEKSKLREGEDFWKP
ncbi:MAG: hypothetical protein FWH22_10360 [Fibromonadales bacterium]|nr:hypothetical protein [Fibromonadales bacterium]